MNPGRSLIRQLAACAAALLLPAVVHAHTAWIGSSRYTVEDFAAEPPSTVNLFFGWGEVPPVQDFIRDGSRIEQFVMRHPNGRLQSLSPGTAGFRAVEVALAARGSYLVGTAIKPYFHTYAEQNGQVVALSKPRSALPRGTPVFESQFRRIFAKTILTVGGREDVASTDVGQPLGHSLEIIPLAHPGKLRPGDALPFEVRYEGKPIDVMRLENRPIVRANYIGFSQREEYPWSSELDDKGRGLLPLRVPGVWQILVEQHMPWHAGQDRDAREEVLKALLMFEVR